MRKRLDATCVHASAAVSPPRVAVTATVETAGKSVRLSFKDGGSVVMAMRDAQAVSFDAPIISEDRRTVAWTEGGVVQGWQFRAYGQQLYVACGYPHFNSAYHCRNPI